MVGQGVKPVLWLLFCSIVHNFLVYVSVFGNMTVKIHTQNQKFFYDKVNFVVNFFQHKLLITRYKNKYINNL